MMPEWKNHAIAAVRIVREPRRPGGPPLVMADDDHYYWVKTNSFSDRSAAREAAACTLAGALGLSTPGRAVIDTGLLSDAFEREDGTPSRRLAFGSRLHADGLRAYDYIPESCFDWIKNPDEMAQWAAFDVWVANAEATQPVFYGSLQEGAEVFEIRALKISHTRCFAGFSEQSFEQTIERKPDRYHVAADESDCSRMVERIRALSADDLQSILESAPEGLLDSPYRDLLFEGLRIRQKQLAHLVAESFSESVGAAA